MHGPHTVAARRMAKRAAIQGGLEAVSLLARAGLMPGARGLGAIFTLHHVRPATHKQFDPAAHLSVTPEFLDTTIRHLKSEGYVPVALEDLTSFLALPERPGPAMVFTLDDGYRDNDEFARPVFERHSIPYTIFVSGGFVDRTHSIWWETAEQLIAKLDEFVFDFGDGERALRTRTMPEKYAAFDMLHKSLSCTEQQAVIARLDTQAKDAGICPTGIVDREVMNEAELRAIAERPLSRLGAHTIGHVNLAHSPEARMRDEIAKSAERVADITGETPKTLAYPYGDRCAAGPREYAAAEDLGFELAVTTNPGVLTERSAGSRYTLPRISLNGYYQRGRYVNALASGIPFAFSKSA
ncbi:polysaccharide deacetylase family protein [Hoeflea sp.]|uniref:polysaccharide deacetylase family protein n=1 Tax=Hoeflea sp. TaxID=1940281 RepID=UPI003B522923